VAVEWSHIHAPDTSRTANRGIVFEWRLAHERRHAVRIELRVAFDCFHLLAVGIKSRADFGVGVETFSVRPLLLRAILSRCRPRRFPVDARADVWRAVEIRGGDRSMRGRTDLRSRRFDND